MSIQYPVLGTKLTTSWTRVFFQNPKTRAPVIFNSRLVASYELIINANFKSINNLQIIDK